jgi:hypothetical protein
LIGGTESNNYANNEVLELNIPKEVAMGTIRLNSHHRVEIKENCGTYFKKNE